MKKNYIGIFAALSVNFFTVHSQNNFYSYSTGNQTVSDKPRFFNVDSILTTKNYKFSDYIYFATDAKLANDDMEVLGELHYKSFTEKIDHTFIRDIGVLVSDPVEKDIDTVKLTLREFVYKDSAEAKKVFEHLNEKVISAITVPDYRVVYREKNNIYFISVKEYDKNIKKELPKIINPVYETLVAKSNNLCLLFHYERRIRTNAPKK